MLFPLSSSYRGSKGAHVFLRVILRFPCKGITPAFCLELLLCCESVGAGGVLCTLLCWPRATDFMEVYAEVHFGAQNKLTLEQKALLIFNYGATSALHRLAPVLSSSYSPNVFFCSYLTLTFAVASGYVHKSSTDTGLYLQPAAHSSSFSYSD